MKLANANPTTFASLEQAYSGPVFTLPATFHLSHRSFSK